MLISYREKFSFIINHIKNSNCLDQYEQSVKDSILKAYEYLKNFRSKTIKLPRSEVKLRY